MGEQFDFFEKFEEDEKNPEEEFDVTKEEDMSDEKDEKEQEKKEKPKKARGETIQKVKEQMGYAPFLTEEERERRKNQIGPGRAAALELLKKFKEEKNKEGK